jgi:hypothetical protein
MEANEFSVVLANSLGGHQSDAVDLWQGQQHLYPQPRPVKRWQVVPHQKESLRHLGAVFLEATHFFGQPVMGECTASAGLDTITL